MRAGTDETPTWVTGEALMALEGKPLPMAAPARARAGTPPRPRRTAPRHDTPDDRPPRVAPAGGAIAPRSRSRTRAGAPATVERPRRAASRPPTGS